MILTNVEHVYINFKEPNEEKLTDIDVETLKRYAKEGKFAEGSMLPKIEAAIDFVESGSIKKRSSLIWKMLIKRSTSKQVHIFINNE